MNEWTLWRRIALWLSSPAGWLKAADCRIRRRCADRTRSTFPWQCKPCPLSDQEFESLFDLEFDALFGFDDVEDDGK